MGQNHQTDTTPFIERFKIFTQCPILFLWFTIYFLISWSLQGLTPKGFFITAGIYFIIISVALSDFIEIIMRNLEDVRELAVRKEKERLIPLIEEVYQKVKEQTPEISNHIKLYIVDEISINAFALGNKTIAVTRGLIEVMDDEEIKGILAHEMGHMAHNDSRIQILITVGSTIYLWGFIIARWIIRRIEIGAGKETTFTGAIIGIIRWIIELSISIFTLIATILLMAESRKKEYRADKYAVKIGYLYELKQALYKLYDMQLSDKRNLIERFKASHPRIAYRIERLEDIENQVVTE